MWKTLRRWPKTKQRPLLGPNYWGLTKVGLILPKSLLGKIIYIILHEMVTFFVLSQYIELYFIRSDLNMILRNVKVSMMSTIVIFKSNTFLFSQVKWRKVLEYVTAEDVYERNTSDIIRIRIIDSYTKYCHKITYSYWVLVSLTVLTFVVTPIVFISSSSFREELRNGTVKFPHMFSSWVPFDKNENPGTWITTIWYTYVCGYGGCTMAVADSTILVIMVFFGGKLDLIRQRCKQMLGSNGRGVSDKNAMAIIKELHRNYVLLTKHSRLFNSLLSPVMFLYVVMCSLMLCASAFQLTSTNNATQKILLAEYLIFGVAQLFMFCWHSNDVLIKSGQVSSGPYESQWWLAGVKQRKSVHILAGQLRISHVFTAGPFTNLTLSTFITILKGAYSYYTLLRK